MGVTRKLDLSCIESRYYVNTKDRRIRKEMNIPLLDLYSMTVVRGRFRTLRIVSLQQTHTVSSRVACLRHSGWETHLIFSFDFGLESCRFHREMMSSFCRTLIVHPQISGNSPGGMPSELATAFGPPAPPESTTPSNWSPITARTRSSQRRSATPLRRRMIHLPPERFSGASQTGRRTPEWKRR